jgi:hypothetical protein
MPQLRKLLFSLAAVAAITLASAASARADIIVMTGVNNQGTDNVLLTDATDVAVVEGTVNSGLFGVNFTSSSGTGLLNADASGQAVITPGTGNDPFTSIRFFLDDNATFTRAVFNLNSATDGSVLIRVTGINIDGGVFQEIVEVDANGENFFTVDAINGQLMLSIELIAQGDVEFEDLRQVRIGGTGVAEQPVPEPMTMLLFGTGLAGVAARVRRNRRVRQS